MKITIIQNIKKSNVVINQAKKTLLVRFNQSVNKVNITISQLGKQGVKGEDGTILQDVDYLAQYLISKL